MIWIEQFDIFLFLMIIGLYKSEDQDAFERFLAFEFSKSVSPKGVWLMIMSFTYYELAVSTTSEQPSLLTSYKLKVWPWLTLRYNKIYFMKKHLSLFQFIDILRPSLWDVWNFLAQS